jgi:hypothetical protein
MKPTFLLSALLSGAMMFFGLNALADDGEGDEGHDHHGGSGQSDSEDCQGGHIEGSETLTATVVLVATNSAPTNSGGVATLISANFCGMVVSALSLCVTGLDAGTYDLSVVRKSDSSTVDLGQFMVGSAGGGTNSCSGSNTNRDDQDDQGENGNGDGEQNDGEHDGGDHHDGEQSGGGCSGGFLNCHHVRLPSDLDPMDVGQILVSDTNGTVLLVGDLVNATTNSSIRFKASLRVRNGMTGAVAGKVIAAATAKHGRRGQQVTMLASGVAPNATFSVKVNGQDAGTVKSNAKGKVLVRKVPENLLVVRSIHLVDANGNTAVRAKF